MPHVCEQCHEVTVPTDQTHCANCQVVSTGLYLDFETCSLGRYNNDIIQWGCCAQALDGSGEVKNFSQLVRGGPISEQSTKITGITDDMVKEAPPVGTVMEKFLQWMDEVVPAGSQRVLMGYNTTEFDIPILWNNLERHLGEETAMMMMRRMKIGFHADVLHLARAHVDDTQLPRTKTGRPSFRLGNVYKCLLGKPLQNAHDALADCEAVRAIMVECDAIPMPTDGDNFMSIVATQSELTRKHRESKQQKSGRSFLSALKKKKRKLPSDSTPSPPAKHHASDPQTKEEQPQQPDTHQHTDPTVHADNGGRENHHHEHSHQENASNHVGGSGASQEVAHGGHRENGENSSRQ